MSIRFPAGFVAGPLTVVSASGHYELTEHVVTSSDFTPAGIQMPVIATPSGMLAC